MPLFTIGIPTYNRAGFLRRTLESALDQTHPEVEVVVLDDASTDETPDVVRSFGDRVRYHRHPRNIGSWPNFIAVTELARGEFVSWLQDDDLIHRDFARRATSALSASGDVAVYTTFEVETPSATVFYRPVLYGPPIALDWMKSEPRTIDGALIAPLSVFVSFANMPAIAFRTAILRDAVRHVDPDCEMFNERIVLTRAAATGQVAVDPWPGAIFFKHAQQICRSKYQDDATIGQWLLLSTHLGHLLEELPAERYELQLKRCFEETSIDDRWRWIHEISPGIRVPEEIWERAHPSARAVRSMLVDSLPASLKREYHEEVDREHTARAGTRLTRIKAAVRHLVPPLAWDALRSIRRSVHSFSRAS